MRTIAIIPARWSSSRFPGKPLADIGGMPMIERVYMRAVEALGDDSVAVATDDERIFQAVESFGGKAIMTSASHRSGTDRCYEAYTKMGVDADVIINVQGDEPFINPLQIRQLADCFSDPEVGIATLVRKFDPELGWEALSNPNTPKVVLDNEGNALYFSRSVIPYVRGEEQQDWARSTVFYTHVGMYGYRTDVLPQIVRMPQSQPELAESLEQLRWLSNGYRIRTAVTQFATVGIDTPADLERARIMLENKADD